MMVGGGKAKGHVVHKLRLSFLATLFEKSCHLEFFGIS